MICPICDWLGKVSCFDEHVRKVIKFRLYLHIQMYIILCESTKRNLFNFLQQHAKLIFKTSNGCLSISINLEDIRKCANFSRQYFIEHGKNLYIIHFKYKYPDIIVPIILVSNYHAYCQ